jgi:hypothetical protein
LKIWPVEKDTNVIQDVATQNPNLLLDDQEPSPEDSLKKNELGLDRIGQAGRAIESEQFILRRRALKLETVNGGFGRAMLCPRPSLSASEYRIESCRLVSTGV